MTIRKTFQYKATISKTTAAFANQQLWRCQQLYNLCLEQRIMYWKNWKKRLSAFDQIKQLPDFKGEFVEFKSVNAHCLQQVAERVDKAYEAFFRSLKTGERVGFPRFKSVSRYDSFTLKTSGWRLDGRHLKITGVGIFKLHQKRARYSFL